MNEFHYKCFSEFLMKFECKYDSNSRRYSLEKIKSICIHVTDFDDLEIEEIKRLITSNEKVKVDYHSGFQLYYKCFFTKTQETVLNIFRRFPNKIFPEGAFPTGRGPVFERKREKGFVI